MPAASAGRERRRRTVVIKTDQTNNGVRYCVIVRGFMLIMVVIKLFALRIEDIPAM